MRHNSSLSESDSVSTRCSQAFPLDSKNLSVPSGSIRSPQLSFFVYLPTCTSFHHQSPLYTLQFTSFQHRLILILVIIPTLLGIILILCHTNIYHSNSMYLTHTVSNQYYSYQYYIILMLDKQAYYTTSPTFYCYYCYHTNTTFHAYTTSTTYHTNTYRNPFYDQNAARLCIYKKPDLMKE